MSSVFRRNASVRRTTLVIGCALVATACGSTVQVSGSATSFPEGSGLSVPTAGALNPGSGPSSGGTVSGSTGGGSELGPVGSGSQPGGTAGGTAVVGTTGGSLGGVSVPGVTATQVKVGILYSKGNDEANAAVGVPIVRGDEKSYWQVVIDEVNAHGGVAGRRLVPVYYALDAQSTQTIATQEQASCAHFTQDNRVFAVLSAGSADGEACLARAGVLHATPGSNVGFDRDFHRRYPMYFGQRPSQDRLQADLVSALVRQKYFSGWDTLRGAPAGAAPKVGILMVDYPYITRTVDRVLIPALKRAGYPVDPSAVYRAAVIRSAQEAGPGSAHVQAAVLGFHQKGITHVIVLDVNGSTTLVFVQQSSNQAYYPRMGVTTGSGIQALYDAKLIQSKQLNGASGLGWTPFGDLPAGQSDRYLSSAARSAVKACLDVNKRRAGRTFSSMVAASLALYSCDAAFTFARALQSVGGELTLASAVRAYESVGRRLVSASVGRLFFSPTHHDGLEIAYDWVWDANCPCMRYPDSGHPMP